MNASLVNNQVKPNSICIDKRQLRKSVRKKRQSLSKLQQKTASQKLLRKLKNSACFLRSTHIALYLGNDGEICPSQLIPLLKKWKKKTYLPVIHPLKRQTISFCEVNEKTLWRRNRYNILEPDFALSKRFATSKLSLVLMPLVAFDTQGNRMGMGGGYYDRAFSYKHLKPNTRPKLIGLAHDFQKQDALPINEWDVALDAIATEKKIYTNKF